MTNKHNPALLSQDGIFNARLSELPLDHLTAMKNNGLCNAGTLRSYPRTLSSGAVYVRPVLSSVTSVESGPLSLLLPSADTQTDTRTPLVEDLTELVPKDAEGADGFSKTTHDGSSELSDGFSTVKTKTRLATKSTVIHQLPSSAKLPERLDDCGKFEFSELPGFGECEGLSHKKIRAVSSSNLSVRPALQVMQRS